MNSFHHCPLSGMFSLASWHVTIPRTPFWFLYIKITSGGGGSKFIERTLPGLCDASTQQRSKPILNGNLSVLYLNESGWLCELFARVVYAYLKNMTIGVVPVPSVSHYTSVLRQTYFLYFTGVYWNVFFCCWRIAVLWTKNNMLLKNAWYRIVVILLFHQRRWKTRRARYCHVPYYMFLFFFFWFPRFNEMQL